jgi:polar amino acid transport system permease protein
MSATSTEERLAVDVDAVTGGVRRLAPPPRSLPLAASAVVGVLAVVTASWVMPLRAVQALDASESSELAATIVAVVFGALSLFLLLPAVQATILSFRSRGQEADGDIVASRQIAAQANEKSRRALGYALAVVVLLGVLLFLLANDAAIIETFLSWDQISRSAVDILRASWLNVWIAVVAECLILVFALTLALVRLSPSRAMAPLRWLAIAYVDVFRAIPLIILLYLVAFGIPIAGIPVLSDLPTTWLIVIGLTITTSAYVAEVFRSAIESVHWSQTAAAKSLGFSSFQTSRYVVVPQAVRRVIPPLLSYFIGLQKDTALVLVVGAIDAFGQAKIYAGNYFNLSSVTFVAVIFIAITIPQTRLVDYLLAREERKTGMRRL